ncbi:MAG: hypothetical protein WD358_00070 [Nitriliruptoraceae bacterium]
MQLWDDIVDALQAMAVTAVEWVPRILLALVVLIVGRFVLGFIRRIIVKLLDLAPVRAVFDRAGLTSATEPSGRSPAQMVGTIVYAVLFIVLWIIVFDILQLFTIVDILQRFLAWIPVVLVAAAIVLIAAAVASWVSDLISPYARARNVEWLPGVVRAGVIIFGALAALEVLNITFAEDLVKIVVAGAVVAFAIAFGVGGIDTAKKWWSRYLNPPERQSSTSQSPTGQPPTGQPPMGGPSA